MVFVSIVNVQLETALLFGLVRAEGAAEGPAISALIPLVFAQAALVSVGLVAVDTLVLGTFFVSYHPKFCTHKSCQ